MSDYPIEANDRTIEIPASAGQTLLTTDFPIEAAEDLVVQLRRLGEVVTLELTEDYTVAGIDEAGGSEVTLVQPALLNDVYVLFARTAIERASDYTLTGPFRAAAVNREFDKSRMIEQELRRDADRNAARIAELEALLVDTVAGQVPPGTIGDEHLAAPSKARWWNATRISSGAFGIQPGTTDKSSVIQTLAQRNDVPETVVMMPGEYPMMEVQVTKPVHFDLSRARFSQYAATAGRCRLWRFMPGAEGAVITGGLRLDGRRSALAGGWTWNFMDGWTGASVECADVSIDRLILENWLDFPCLLWGDNLTIGEIISRNNAGAVAIGPRRAAAVAGAAAKNIDIGRIRTIGNVDQGAPGQYQHAVTAYLWQGGRLGSLLMQDQGGDTGASNWTSGFTVIDGEDLQFGQLRYIDPVADTKQHLPFTFIGLRRAQIDSLMARNFAGQGLELDTLEDVQIGKVFIDGCYRATTAVPEGSDQNVAYLQFSYGHYPTQTRQAIAGCRNVQIGHMITQRMTSFGTPKTGGVNITKLENYGMLHDGPNGVATDSAGSFPVAFKRTRPAMHIDHLISRGNGRRGFMCGGDGGTVSVGYADVCDNGQDATGSTDQRTGIYLGSAAVLNDQVIRLLGGAVRDRQNYTVVGGLSFRPGSTDAKNEYVFTLCDMNRLNVGYHVKLVGIDGGADITGKIVDILRDEARIRFASAKTFAATGLLTALSGTWTQSGRTLTGTGGNATTEINGRPVWITDGAGNWAQVEYTSGTNTIRTYEAFSPAIAAGATLSMLVADFAGVPSQQRGLRAFGTIGGLYLDPSIEWDGNVVDAMSISDLTKLLPGSEYRRRATVNPAAANVNVLTQINRHHQIAAWASNHDAAITTATSYNLRLVTSGASLLATLAAVTDMSKNVKTQGSCPGVIQTADGNVLRLEFNTAPGAGTVTVDTRWRVASVPAIADAP